MNTKQTIVLGLTAVVIAGCCTYDASSGRPADLQLRENIEFVGYQPKDEAAFIKFLKDHNTATYSPIFKVQEYSNGAPLTGAGQVFGLKDIECELQAKIDYWIKNPLPGKTANGGATKYAGEIGFSCSTSCPPPTYRILSSREMADDFRSKFGPPLHSRKHHHEH